MTTYRYATRHGARIAYQVAGNGPTVVLLKNNRRPVDFPAAGSLGDASKDAQHVAQVVAGCLVSRGAGGAG